MRNVRVFYSKKGRMKFASHLDMNRLMTRLIRLSGIPVWYTEGFNRHPYITFALPLSLGFTSEYEIMDIRITDDSFTDDMVNTALSKVFPDGLLVLAVSEPARKAGEIAFAEFEITFDGGDTELAEALKAFLSQPSILTMKKTKKGSMKEIDMAPFIKRFDIFVEDSLKLKIVLAAGGQNNLNPVLLLNAYGRLPYYSVCRTMIFDADMEEFK